jgi:hypothetical protein
MPGLYEDAALKEARDFPFLYRTNFSEGGGNIAKGGRILSGTQGLIRKLVTDDISSGFYSRVAANAQDSNKLVVTHQLWRLRTEGP